MGRGPSECQHSHATAISTFSRHRFSMLARMANNLPLQIKLGSRRLDRGRTQAGPPGNILNHALPTELLLHIFSYFEPPEPFIQPCPTDIVVFSRVCRSWRLVAQSLLFRHVLLGYHEFPVRSRKVSPFLAMMSRATHGEDLLCTLCRELTVYSGHFIPDSWWIRARGRYRSWRAHWRFRYNVSWDWFTQVVKDLPRWDALRSMDLRQTSVFSLLYSAIWSLPNLHSLALFLCDFRGFGEFDVLSSVPALKQVCVSCMLT